MYRKQGAEPTASIKVDGNPYPPPAAWSPLSIGRFFGKEFVVFRSNNGTILKMIATSNIEGINFNEEHEKKSCAKIWIYGSSVPWVVESLQKELQALLQTISKSEVRE